MEHFEEKMKKTIIIFFVVGIIGILITEIVLKNKIPGNFVFPILLIFLGFIYIPFYIGYIINRKNGEAEKDEINFWNFRFYLGLISYPIIVIVYLIYKLFEIIK